MVSVDKRPLSWLKLKAQARKSFDEEGLRRLGESLKKKQLQPVVVRPDGTVIFGERRVRAAMLAGIESLEVKIIDEPLSDSQVKTFQLVENLAREDLMPYEVWTECCDLMAMNVDWQLKDLAEHLDLDPSMVTRIMSASKCTREVQDALKDGKIGVSDCYALSKVAAERQRALLALRLSGATRDELEEAGKASRNGSGTAAAAKVSRAKLVLASGVSIVISGASICLDTAIEALNEAAKHARKARNDRQDLRALEIFLKNQAKGAAS